MSFTQWNGHDSIIPLRPARSAAGGYPRITILITLLLLVSFSILFPPPARAEQVWQKNYKTDRATIHYNNENDLYRFTRKISSGTKTSFLYKGIGTSARSRIDRIVYKVETLLDMHPLNFHFDIYLYPTYLELVEVYRGLGIRGTTPIAFYSHRAKSIYISLEKLNEGVFAHEVAHAVINRYFPTPPPARMQEILAQYVDKHLREAK